MGTFSRIRYVISANLNALVERAEDPEKLLRALIREMEDAGEDARLAAADLLAEQDYLQRVTERLDEEIAEWQQRAEQAVGTDRDDLARAALKAKAELEETRSATRREREALDARVAQLESDMATLKGKLNEAKAKLKGMRTSGRTGANPQRPDDRLSRNERKVRQALGRFDRLQNQVERLEARVRSYEVGGTPPSPWTTGASAADPVIEDELAAIKERVSGKSQETVTADSPASGQAGGTEGA